MGFFLCRLCRPAARRTCAPKPPLSRRRAAQSGATGGRGVRSCSSTLVGSLRGPKVAASPLSRLSGSWPRDFDAAGALGPRAALPPPPISVQSAPTRSTQLSLSTREASLRRISFAIVNHARLMNMSALSRRSTRERDPTWPMPRLSRTLEAPKALAPLLLQQKVSRLSQSIRPADCPLLLLPSHPQSYMRRRWWR